MLEGGVEPISCDPSGPYIVATETTDDAGVTTGEMTSCTSSPANPCPVGDVCARAKSDGTGFDYGVCQ